MASLFGWCRFTAIFSGSTCTIQKIARNPIGEMKRMTQASTLATGVERVALQKRGVRRGHHKQGHKAGTYADMFRSQAHRHLPATAKVIRGVRPYITFFVFFLTRKTT